MLCDMPPRLPDFARITRLRQLFLDQERGARALEGRKGSIENLWTRYRR